MDYLPKAIEIRNTLHVTDERHVLNLIIIRGITHQAAIAQHLDHIHSGETTYHKKHDEPRKKYTLRQVRQLIRNLRLIHHAPICSVRAGYFIPRSSDAAYDYIQTLARTAKSQAKAHFETYNAMKHVLETTSEYFEDQQRTLL